MLTIRQAQIEALREAAQRDFEDRMVVHLRAVFPDETAADELDEQPLRELIRAGIDRAAGHGVLVEADVARFIEYMIYYHAEFDVDLDLPWLSAILARPELDGTEKMDRIDTQTRMRHAAQ